VNTSENTLEVSLPAALLGGSRFRAHLATGLWDPAKRQWKAVQSTADATNPGGGSATSPRAFNVGFRPQETGFWFENNQAAALATGDISAFAADIDLLAADHAPAAVVPGYQQRIFASSATIDSGEGIAADYPGVPGRGNYPVPYAPTRFNYLGRYQPYAVYVPAAGYDRMIIELHGAGYSHGLITLSPHYAAMADAAQAVLIAPLGRGVYGFYTDYGQLDVLEAYRDALAVYGTPRPLGAVDPLRTTLWGYSMGGLGVDRLTVLNPDLFASSVRWAAAAGLERDNEPADTATGHPGNGYPIDLAVNTRGKNWLIRHCTGDEVAPYAGVLPLVQALDELRYTYRFRSLVGCDHLLPEIPQVPVTYLDYTDDARQTEAARIDPNPARVTYRTSEAWWRPDISPELVFDHAYWISGLRVRDTSAGLTAYGTADATTHGRLDTQPDAVATPPASGTQGTYPYLETGRQPEPTTDGPTTNKLSAALTNLRAVTFDLPRMNLRTTSPLSVSLTTDGPVEIRLHGTAPNTGATDCTSTPCPVVTMEGAVSTFALPVAGTYSLVLKNGREGATAGGHPDSSGAGPGGSLASTGPAASSAGASLGLLLFAAAARRHLS
jgi:hypothetical protein